MLNNGFAETKTIAPGVNPPAIVIHPELGIGENPVKTHWHDSFWFEYVLNLVVFKWKCIKYKAKQHMMDQELNC